MSSNGDAGSNPEVKGWGQGWSLRLKSSRVQTYKCGMLIIVNFCLILTIFIFIWLSESQKSQKIIAKQRGFAKNIENIAQI